MAPRRLESNLTTFVTDCGSMKVTDMAFHELRALPRLTRRMILQDAANDNLASTQGEENLKSSSGYELSSTIPDGQKRRIFARTMDAKETRSAIIPIPAEMYFNLWVLLIPIAQKHGLHILQPYGHSQKTVYVPWVHICKPSLNAEQQSVFSSMLCQLSTLVTQEYMPLVNEYLMRLGFVPAGDYCFEKGRQQLHIYPELEPRNLTSIQVHRKKFWETDEQYVRRILEQSIFFDPIYAAYNAIKEPV